MADKPAPKPGHFLPGGAGTSDSADSGSGPGAGPLAAPTARLGAGAPAGPPQLSGSRLESRRTPQLSGTRFGPPPPNDPAAAAFRAVYAPEPLPYVPKQRSKALIAVIVVAALVVVGGGLALAAKMFMSYDDFLATPLGTPSYRPSGAPKPTAEPTPDAVVQKENPLYTTGPLATVKCQEPAYRPTSKENVESYYQALIGCMDRAWQPLVTEAGFEFRSPRLIVFDDGQETACGIQQDVSSYCADEQGGSVTMPWQELSEDYPKDKANARAEMAQVRDHGSAKSLALWMNQGFASTDPGTCNTFVAASAKVG